MSRYTHFPRLEYNVPDQEMFQGQNRYITAFMVTGVLHFVLGALCVILGVAAIPMMCWFAYFAVPIWAGLLFFGTTGLFGILSAFNRRRPMKVVYLLMCILSTWMALAMIVLFSIAAVNEFTVDSTFVPVCVPAGYWINFCPKSMVGRRAIDILIAVTASAECVVCIVGSSFACCKSCDCCEPCCRSSCRCCLNCCNPPPLYPRQDGNTTTSHQVRPVPHGISVTEQGQNPNLNPALAQHNTLLPGNNQGEDQFVVQATNSSRSSSPYVAGRSDLAYPPPQVNLGFEEERILEAGLMPEKKDF